MIDIKNELQHINEMLLESMESLGNHPLDVAFAIGAMVTKVEWIINTIDLQEQKEKDAERNQLHGC